MVIGSGPGGYTAAFRAADLGMDVMLVERYAQLGGVCLNVGCIPSKALLHAANVIEEVKHVADIGLDFGAAKIDLDKLRAHKEKTVGTLSKGIAGMAKQRKVRTVTGVAEFASANRLSVQTATGIRDHRFRAVHHRRRFAAGETAGLPVGGSAGDGFHRCADAA